MTALLFALAHEAIHIAAKLTVIVVWSLSGIYLLIKGIDRLRPVKIRRPS